MTAAFVVGDEGALAFLLPLFFLLASVLQDEGLVTGFSFFSFTGLFAVLATVAAHEKGAGAVLPLATLVAAEETLAGVDAGEEDEVSIGFVL